MLSGYGRCFSRDEFSDALELHKELMPDWVGQAVKAFETIVNEDEFPCLFGKKAMKSESSRFLFVSEQRAASDIAAGLGSYIGQVRSWTIKCRVSRPLVIFLEKRCFPSLADEQRYAWSVLQQLHERDPSPWPEGISTNIKSENWSFCFMGMPLFINMSFPQHRQMKSRNLGPYIVFVINPRENFDYVASGESQSGRLIRARIRSRSETYNQGAVSPSLGFFGERGNLELKQYQLEEPGSLSHEQCPFHMKLEQMPAVASEP